MASLRLDTQEDPDRKSRIEKKLKQHNSTISIIGRALFEALERFIDENERLPQKGFTISDKESGK